MNEGESFLLALVAILCPPAAVAFISGCGVDLCLNILLTLLGWLPGCIHAFWLLIKRSEANEKYGYKNWTYEGNGRFRAAQPQPPPAGQQAQPYTQTQPPQTQAPAEEKQTGYAAPAPQAPATGEQKSGSYTAPPQGVPEQQQAENVPPPPPAGQKA